MINTAFLLISNEINCFSERAERKKQQEVMKAQINDLKGEIASLEHQISTEGANAEAERKRASSLQDQLKEREMNPGNRDSNSPRSSPTLSFGRVSLSESLSSNLWPQVISILLFILYSSLIRSLYFFCLCKIFNFILQLMSCN